MTPGAGTKIPINFSALKKKKIHYLAKAFLYINNEH